MPLENGWIKIHRSLIDWRWYKDVNTTRVFLHLILTANIKDSAFENQIIKRGELVTSRKQLALALNLSERNIRTALNHLKSTNEVTTRATPKYTIITVNNYSLYQQSDQRNDQQVTSDRPHNKKNKKKKNNNNIAPPDSSDEAAIICLPLNDKSLYSVSNSDVEHYRELYPGVNVEQELRNMCGWLESNPRKRKTKSGITRFINNWLSKEQNKGGTTTNTTENKPKQMLTPEEAKKVIEMERNKYG